MDENSHKVSFYVPALTVAPVALTLFIDPPRIVPNSPFGEIVFLLPMPIVEPAPLITLAMCTYIYVCMMKGCVIIKHRGMRKTISSICVSTGEQQQQQI